MTIEKVDSTGRIYYSNLMVVRGSSRSRIKHEAQAWLCWGWN